MNYKISYKFLLANFKTILFKIKHINSNMVYINLKKKDNDGYVFT